jgi:hypothetical protein
MEIVYRFNHRHNGVDYHIQIEKGAITHRIAVYPADSAQSLFSYKFPLKSWDNPKPDKARAFWFFVAARAFDFVNAQPW